ERRLRDTEGVTVLVYDQACAAELRRERKRGRADDPDKRVFIHEGVCEGCGDCNVQSNCISVEPLETELGRKRTIDQSSCNKDFSCLGGYCPSFVTLRGATPRRSTPVGMGGAGGSVGSGAAPDDLPDAPVPSADEPYNVLIGGIGGSGVLTIGALLGMGAHVEGKSVSVLNESGMAQKNGAVQSHVRIADEPGLQLSSRIAAGQADLVIGADIVVTASDGPVACMAAGRTRAVVSDDVRPTVAFSAHADLDLSSGRMAKRIRRATGDQLDIVSARAAALALMGDAIYTNLLLLGFAAQRGLVPVSVAALERAIEINGVGVDANKDALRWGRLLAHDPARLDAARGLGPAETALAGPVTVEELIADRADRLAAYQDRAYAARYRAAVRRVVTAEQERTPGLDGLTDAVARNLFKLMAYKDEYEVARLYADPEFAARLEREFEGDYRISVNLAPQMLNRRDPRTGRARKWEVPGSLALPAFRVLARARRVRGTRLDPFGRTAHRQAERTRIERYEALLVELVAALGPDTHALAVQLASLPDTIRGYDTVKDASAAVAEEKEAELLEQLRALSDRTTPARPGAPAGARPASGSGNHRRRGAGP
ncbi:MAG TPA: DUF6537 domain-containing protein, partial [Iamia sp.]|nr:DUF6537 domain-containing protein [Iamia sp.]